jgi:flagellar motor switch protein FliM
MPTTKCHFDQLIRLSDEELASLQLIHHTFAEKLAFRLSTDWNTPVNITLDSISQEPISHYLKGLPKPTFISTASSEYLSKELIIEVNPNIIYTAIESLLGNTADYLRIHWPLSNLEQGLTRKFFMVIINELSETWANFLKTTFSLNDFMTSPPIPQELSQEKLAVTLFFKVKWKKKTSLISLAFLTTSLLPIVNLIEKKTNSEPFTSFKHENQKHPELNQIPVSITAILGKLNLSIPELKSLQVGDILELNHPLSKPIEIRIEEGCKLKGVVGLVGRNRAILLKNH